DGDVPPAKPEVVIDVHQDRNWPGLGRCVDFNPGAHQNGGWSSKLPPPRPLLAGVADAHESFPPPEPPLVRDIFCTFAVAYRSDGPISSTSSSMTVRFSPSLVS